MTVKIERINVAAFLQAKDGKLVPRNGAAIKDYSLASWGLAEPLDIKLAAGAKLLWVNHTGTPMWLAEIYFLDMGSSSRWASWRTYKVEFLSGQYDADTHDEDLCKLLREALITTL
jgi:hypothetical protein